MYFTLVNFIQDKDVYSALFLTFLQEYPTAKKKCQSLYKIIRRGYFFRQDLEKAALGKKKKNIYTVLIDLSQGNFPLCSFTFLYHI